MGVNERGYEKRDLSLSAILLFAGSLIIALIVLHFLALKIFHSLASRPTKYPVRSALASTRAEFTGPRLLVDQKQDMARFRASEDILLSSYGWVDQSRGVVHIPIDRAIELLAQKGRQP